MVEKAFAEFLGEHSQPMMRLAFVLSRNHHDAQDLCQEAFLRAYKNWSKVSAAKNPGAYVRRILVNEHLRRGSRRIPQPADLVEEPAEETGYAEVEDESSILSLLAGLPAKQQAALALRYLEDRNYSEVAAVLRCRESTARSLVRRGLRAIQSRHPDQYPSPDKKTNSQTDSGPDRESARDRGDRSPR